MKVKDLIEELKKLDQERIVVLAIDEEGNSFHELVDVATAMYSDGDTGLEELTPELKKKGYTEEDVMSDGQKAVVLWP